MFTTKKQLCFNIDLSPKVQSFSNLTQVSDKFFVLKSPLELKGAFENRPAIKVCCIPIQTDSSCTVKVASAVIYGAFCFPEV